MFENFSCLCIGSGRPEEDYMMLRQMISKELSEHPENYLSAGYREQYIREYAPHVTKFGFFGGDLELRAFVHLINRTVKVYTINRTPDIFQGTSEAPDIELGYVCDNHFDLLLPEDVEYQASRVISIAKTNKQDTSNKDQISDKQLKDILNSSVIQLAPNKDIEETNTTLTKLLQTSLLNRESAIKWLQELGIFYTERTCEKCGKPMTLKEPTQERPDGEFGCRFCNTRASIRKPNIFSYRGVPPHKIAQVFIRLFKKEQLGTIAHETELGIRTVSRYYEDLLGASIILLEKHSTKIGGENRVVEIDECLLHRRKYNEGRIKEAGWVLGGVERPRDAHDKPRIFLANIPDRSQETLEKVITQWVEPGTIILTDGLRSYNNLKNIGYHHFSVNHSEHFVDPESWAHTERIEGLWHWIRVQALPRSGCRLENLDFHLALYLYRRSIDGNIIRFLQDLCTIDKTSIEAIVEEKKNLGKTYNEIREKEKKEAEANGSQPHQSAKEKREQKAKKLTETKPSNSPASIVKKTLITSPKSRNRMIPFPPPEQDPKQPQKEPYPEPSWPKELQQNQGPNPFELVVQMKQMAAIRANKVRAKPKAKTITGRPRGRPKGSKNRPWNPLETPSESTSSEESSSSITVSDDDDLGPRKRKRPMRYSPTLSPSL